MAIALLAFLNELMEIFDVDRSRQSVIPVFSGPDTSHTLQHRFCGNSASCYACDRAQSRPCGIPNDEEVRNSDILRACEEIRIPQSLFGPTHCAALSSGEF